MAKVLEFQLQHPSFQGIFRTDFLQDGLVGSPCIPRDSQESSPTLPTPVFIHTLVFWASLVAQLVKNLPAVWETWIQFLGWEDLLEKGMATHSSVLAWRIPWTEQPGRLQSTGSQRLGHDLAIKPPPP